MESSSDQRNYVSSRLSPIRKGASILSIYRESYASISTVITATESFSSLIDYEDDARVLEQARKDVTSISPVMLKYSRSSSLRIYDGSSVHDTVEFNNNSPRYMTFMRKLRRHVSGPRGGTFENASQDHSSLELDKTYIRFRMHEDIARMVMDKVHCNVPAFHSKEINFHSKEISDTWYDELNEHSVSLSPTH
jgi:hypothetical protein